MSVFCRRTVSANVGFQWVTMTLWDFFFLIQRWWSMLVVQQLSKWGSMFQTYQMELTHTVLESHLVSVPVFVPSTFPQWFPYGWVSLLCFPCYMIEMPTTFFYSFSCEWFTLQGWCIKDIIPFLFYFLGFLFKTLLGIVCIQSSKCWGLPLLSKRIWYASFYVVLESVFSQVNKH